MLSKISSFHDKDLVIFSWVNENILSIIVFKLGHSTFLNIKPFINGK